MRGVEKRLNARAGFLVALGRRAREIMDPAMHISVLAGREFVHRLEHVLGLLRGRRIVEIDQRTAVHFAREDREIAPQCCNVVFIGLYARLDVHGSACPIDLSAASSRCQRASCTAGSTKSSIASSRNARISKAFASTSGKPRERK